MTLHYRPLFLLAYHKLPVVGICLLVAALVGSVAAQFVFSYDSFVFSLYDLTNKYGFGNSSDMYIRPWFRIQPYLVGILGGIAWVNHRTALIAYFQDKGRGTSV